MIKAIKAFVFFVLVFFCSSPLYANDEEEIVALLANEKMPEGVVFEVIGSGGEYLQKALEKIESYQARLKEKFPDIEIAVVSHGIEQFALKQSQVKDNETSHKLVKQFVEDNIPVHVCETHAGWLGVTAEDFPDYINVAPAGPVQIRQYEDLGYQLIIIE
jgi:intracellular sulfur oxidation DsrE/DsrF family protein